MSYLLIALHALSVAIGTQVADAADLRAYTVDRAGSELYVFVHRAGLLSFLGHEHAIIPMEWSADLCLSDTIPAGAHAAVVLQTQSLIIDSDSARQVAHMGGGPDEEARREIQQRMLDSDHLAAELYPEIRLDLVASEAAEGDRVRVTGDITLRGETRSVELPVTVEHAEAGALLLSGRLRVRQRDFGIEPESRAGLVKVADDVDLHFRLRAVPTDRVCRSLAR